MGTSAGVESPRHEEGLSLMGSSQGSISRKHTAGEAAASLSSYFSRRFVQGCAMLFPIVVTMYATWWILQFFDAFFSPLYEWFMGYHVFGLGFITSMLFIFATGVFASSWVGGALVNLGEWIIRRLPLVKHIYNAAKQVSSAVSPDHETANSFRECVLIRHPRAGEYAFGFITGTTYVKTDAGELQLNTVYVPTNHVYVGDVFLLEDKDVIRVNLSVREGIEIVVSVGMAVPSRLFAERL
jgi:uncharacterized membrane protein